MHIGNILPYKESVYSTDSFLFNFFSTVSSLTIIFWFISLPLEIDYSYYVIPYIFLLYLLFFGPTTTPSFKFGLIELRIIEYLKYAKELFVAAGSLLFLFLFVNYYFKLSDFLYFKSLESLDLLGIIEKSFNLFAIIFLFLLTIVSFSCIVVPMILDPLLREMIKSYKKRFSITSSISTLLLFIFLALLYSDPSFYLFRLLEKAIPIMGFSLLWIHLTCLIKLIKKIKPLTIF